MNKILILFLVSFFIAEAKQVEIHFDKSNKKEFIFDNLIDDNAFEQPWHDAENRVPAYIQTITFTNKGNTVVKEMLPSANNSGYFTLKQLSHTISKEPIRKLFNLWTRSVFISNNDESSFNDPLYILNFKGYCNKSDYLVNFVKLCNLLGIEARPVKANGKTFYDFSFYDHEWEFFDPVNKQFCLAWNNLTACSSETFMDDPLLALRTKTHRKQTSHNFVDAAKELAYFEIVNSILLDPLTAQIVNDSEPIKKFDLWPGEKVIYKSNPESIPLHPRQWLVNHAIDPVKRVKAGRISYAGPFPLRMINNATNGVIKINEQSLQPGETYFISQPAIFSLDIGCDEVANLNGVINVYSTCSQSIVPHLKRGTNRLDLGTRNYSSIALEYVFDADLEKMGLPHVKVANENRTFYYTTPTFQLEKGDNEIEQIWWQISPHPDFSVVPSSLENVEPYQAAITLSDIQETFINNNERYFFRVKGCIQGTWSTWSPTFVFKALKPEPVDAIDFDKIEENSYEITWRPAGKGEEIEYLVFGSNSLDFVPSIYHAPQINEIDGDLINQIAVDNLVLVTKERKIKVDGSLSYYRIIARYRNQLSIPSRLVHVYDDSLHLTRNILQFVEVKEGKELFRRLDFPQSQSGPDPIHQAIMDFELKRSLQDKLATLVYAKMRAQVEAPQPAEIKPYVRSPHVSQEVWDAVRKYFLPENHPIKSRLDRLFSARRVIQTPQSFKDCGFVRNRVGRFSRVLASSHPHLQGYYIKAFCDAELTIRGSRADWIKLVHRIEGALRIKACIAKHGLQNSFKVPRKYLYPLPPEPSPPDTPRYIRKNFILVCDDCRIFEHEKNNKMYKRNMTHELMDGLYIIIAECGLADSLYAFNVPFCKDGKLAFIDTEYWDKHPVKFSKFEKYFSSDMQKYWEKLIRENGPRR